MSRDDDAVDYDQYFSGDEHAPEMTDGGPDESSQSGSKYRLPPLESYRRYYGKSFAVGFLPTFLFLLTGMTEVWWGLLVAGVAVAVGASETDNPTLKKVVGQPLVFTVGLVVGLLLGFAFVEVGIVITPPEVPTVIA